MLVMLDEGACPGSGCRCTTACRHAVPSKQGPVLRCSAVQQQVPVHNSLVVLKVVASTDGCCHRHPSCCTGGQHKAIACQDACICQPHLAQRIISVHINARIVQHKLWPQPLQQWRQGILQCLQEQSRGRQVTRVGQERMHVVGAGLRSAGSRRTRQKSCPQKESSWAPTCRYCASWQPSGSATSRSLRCSS